MHICIRIFSGYYFLHVVSSTNLQYTIVGTIYAYKCVCYILCHIYIKMCVLYVTRRKSKRGCEYIHIYIMSHQAWVSLTRYYCSDTTRHGVNRDLPWGLPRYHIQYRYQLSHHRRTLGIPWKPARRALWCVKLKDSLLCVP